MTTSDLLETVRPEEETVDFPHSAPDSVGLVESKSARLFVPPGALKTHGGASLGPIDVAYETYGKLSPARDNAVFVCHALTGDAHAAGWHSPDDKKPGWWDGFIGPGKALDTNRYFVVCANMLGGCQGTTGPRSVNPVTGRPHCGDFPVVTVRDVVDVHRELLRKELGVERLLSAVGGSLGGMQVLEWAARYPDEIDSAVVIASAANLSAQGIAFNAVGRRAISTDPEFHSGRYKENGDGGGPRYGLAIARMLAHITYLSESSIESKFGRRLQDLDSLAYDLTHETEFQIESYLHYQGKRFVERFDANSYLYLTKAMDYFHLADAYGSIGTALGRTDARFLLISYSTDWLFPTIQTRELTAALIAAGRRVTFVELDSPYGHDSFLIDMEPLQELVDPFLRQ